jgi:hypothetical protein
MKAASVRPGMGPVAKMKTARAAAWLGSKPLLCGLRRRNRATPESRIEALDPKYESRDPEVETLYSKYETQN